MQILERWSITDDYSIAKIDEYPEIQYMELFNKHMLPDHPILNWNSTLSADQKTKQQSLRDLIKDRFQLKLILMHKEELVGWSYGWQDSVHYNDFYMASSLVLPEHRGKGLYTAMVQKVLELVKEDGFSAIRSRHICTNNPVLIAKLKIGFIINGFEQDEIMGTLVRMIYHQNDLRKKSSHFRAGKYADKEILHNLLGKT